MFLAYPDFLPIYADFARRSHADTHLIPIDAKDSDLHVLAYHQLFSNPPSEDQHCCLPFAARCIARGRLYVRYRTFIAR
jgi:hypothetical protein